MQPCMFASACLKAKGESRHAQKVMHWRTTHQGMRPLSRTSCTSNMVTRAWVMPVSSQCMCWERSPAAAACSAAALPAAQPTPAWPTSA